jgi:hypothetical protein
MRAAIRPRSAERLIMPERPRTFNAWKHGGYSNLDVLPGEDPKQFNLLHQSLIDEFAPSGPTECDVVLNLTKCMWRKSHLSIYAKAAAARKEWDAVFQGGDLDLQIKAALQAEFDQLKAALKAEIDSGKEFDPKEFDPQWLETKKLIKAFAIKNVKNKSDVREAGIALRLTIEEQITPESLIEELELYDRLDARIDRLIKRIFQLKGMKQVVGLGPRSHDAAHPKLASSR